MPGRERRRAFTIVEALLAMVLVSGVAIALLTSMRASAKASAVAQRQKLATDLASDMLAEVLAAPYDTLGSGGIMMETQTLDALLPVVATSSSAGHRLAKTNAMSYNANAEASLVTKSGKAVPNTSGWGRSVAVRYASPANIAVNPGSDQGLVFVTVIVTFGGGEVARATGLRSRAWDELMRGEGLGQ